MRVILRSVRTVLVVSAVLGALCADGQRTPAARPAGTWQNTGDMHDRREYAGGILLRTGSVLAVSGHPLAGRSLDSAELYNPTTGQWTVTGSLRHPRNSGNAAVLLDDGRVLLAGGNTNTASISAAEVYDPASGAWRDVAPLSVPRDAPAVRLMSGRVLVAGGIDWTIGEGKAHDVAEVFDPKSNRWAVVGPMRTARYAHRMIVLPDGRVLAIGGYQQGDRPLAGTEFFDPRTGKWADGPALSSPRVAFAIAALPDGSVLVAGGFTGSTWRQRRYVEDAALFDPRMNRWRPVAPLCNPRAGLSLTRLADGRVLAAGGWTNGEADLATAEIFDPRTEKWTPAAGLLTPRRNHRAALLPDGRVLVMGGSTAGGSVYLRSCELFSP